MQAKGKSAGQCESEDQAGNLLYGWFVPYHRVPGLPKDAREAVINLLVLDLSAPVAYATRAVPFCIDTGTDVTLVPRKLLPPGAFPRERAINPNPEWIIGPCGGKIVGLRFRAGLLTEPSKVTKSALTFGSPLEILVVDYWDNPYGMLGLNALRTVIMISDRDHITFWPQYKEILEGLNRVKAKKIP